MAAVETSVVSEERDWITELEREGVIALAGFSDARGSPAYKLLGFPSGEKGERLRKLFDQHVQQGK